MPTQFTETEEFLSRCVSVTFEYTDLRCHAGKSVNSTIQVILKTERNTGISILSMYTQHVSQAQNITKKHKLYFLIHKWMKWRIFSKLKIIILLIKWEWNVLHVHRLRCEGWLSLPVCPNKSTGHCRSWFEIGEKIQEIKKFK